MFQSRLVVNDNNGSKAFRWARVLPFFLHDAKHSIHILTFQSGVMLPRLAPLGTRCYRGVTQHNAIDDSDSVCRSSNDMIEKVLALIPRNVASINDGAQAILQSLIHPFQTGISIAKLVLVDANVLPRQCTAYAFCQGRLTRSGQSNQKKNTRRRLHICGWFKLSLWWLIDEFLHPRWRSRRP